MSDSVTTPVFAHKAGDGGAFVSFGVGYEHIDPLDCSGPFSAVEWVEGRFFSQDWADDLIDDLVAEPDRYGDYHAPPEVGSLTFDPVAEEVLSLTLAEPDRDEVVLGGEQA